MLLAILLVLALPPATSAQTVFTVQPGEHLDAWCARLEARRVLRCADLDSLAARPYKNLPPPIAGRPPRSRFEGLFAPGRYTLAQKRPAAAAVLKRLLTDADDRLALAPIHGLDAQQQRVLASLVHKEAARPDEYLRVAAVFLNRLRRDDYLGSCPALEYALGYHRPFLLFKDIDKAADSPYNLYRRRGLPPTPICFFDDEALQAVRQSVPDPTLYFFVRDWAADSLAFADTGSYDLHRKNAERAKENYRRAYGNIRRLFPGVFYRNPLPRPTD